MPNKYIKEHSALIGVGAIVLQHLKHYDTVSGLWDAVREDERVFNYRRFVLALDLLFMLGTVILENGRLVRVST